MAAGPQASTRTSAARRGVGPRDRRGGGPAAEQVEGVPGDGQVVLGGHHRQPQRQRRVAGHVGPVGQHDLVV